MYIRKDRIKRKFIHASEYFCVQIWKYKAILWGTEAKQYPWLEGEVISVIGFYGFQLLTQSG